MLFYSKYDPMLQYVSLQLQESNIFENDSYYYQHDVQWNEIHSLFFYIF